MVFLQLIHRGNVLLGDNEHMHGGFGIDVFKHDEIVVFMDDLSRLPSLHDLAEYTRHNCYHPSCLGRRPGGSPLLLLLILVPLAGTSVYPPALPQPVRLAQ